MIFYILCYLVYEYIKKIIPISIESEYYLFLVTFYLFFAYKIKDKSLYSNFSDINIS